MHPKMLGPNDFPYVWHTRKKLPDRFGQECRLDSVATPGQFSMRNATVTFPDGLTVRTTRYWIRLKGEKE
jgi:hypothetical protein